MDAFCDICGRQWDARDPGVAYRHGDGIWECRDEEQCFARRAIARAITDVVDDLTAYIAEVEAAAARLRLVPHGDQ